MEDMQTRDSNLPLTLLFLGLVFVFSSLRLLTALACKKFGGLRDSKTLNILGGSAVAYLHAIPACFFSSVLLVRAGDWSVTEPTNLHVAAANTQAESALMVYTLAFMTYDTLFMIFSLPDLLYTLHHLATILYIGSVLYVGRGARGLCLCLLWGEITNPVQNTWIIIGALLDAGHEGLFGLRKILTYATAWELFLLRTFYLPYGLLYVLWKGLLSASPEQGAGGVPYALRVIWFLVPCAIIAGTFLFIKGILDEQRQRNQSYRHKKS